MPVEIPVKAGGSSPAVIEKDTVAVDLLIDAFPERLLNEVLSQLSNKPGSGCSLDTMDRPQNLIHSVKINDVAAGPAWMIDCEALVIGRVPVLSCDR